METAACVIGGLVLIASSFGLSLLKLPDWALDETEPSAKRTGGAKFQRTVRRCNNLLLAITGGLIIAAGLMPHGKTWMLLWAGVFLAVMVAIVFAGLDACSSMIGYRRAIPEAARRSLGSGE